LGPVAVSGKRCSRYRYRRIAPRFFCCLAASRGLGSLILPKNPKVSPNALTIPVMEFSLPPTFVSAFPLSRPVSLLFLFLVGEVLAEQEPIVGKNDGEPHPHPEVPLVDLPRIDELADATQLKCQVTISKKAVFPTGTSSASAKEKLPC
jgi:hypothetical protein